ncbi:hypothetical protein NEOLI_005318 [Neolecta irregularis DAH-3]|uniref:Uncharacterized protein n=1 Tax=Neolecta irregularis (strain DAH-3) TaxID=1198029 RepID=A0A1U7LL02_NEOID|nr:hypothetical protein NEOLI_005318 [Neolecta irregularis DAH-3]|eukprot:OLL23319.1 hypothetical protein NEOLI_005318 [Neolecta irregularis DAH-3]
MSLESIQLNLLEDPFVVDAKNKDVDLAAWAVAPASRPSPKELLVMSLESIQLNLQEDPFVVDAKNKDVDLAAWAVGLQKKLKR